MASSLCILGRQPAIGLAELENLFTSEVVRPVSNLAAVVDVDPSILPFARLGGSIKAAKVLQEFKTSEWSSIEDYLIKALPEHIKLASEGKLTIGLSTYGLDTKPAQVQATALKLKKVARASGKSVRVVPNKTNELSSAQVLHNKLFTDHGWELVLVKSESGTILGQTVFIQDIEAYTKRDQARPKRDAKVGMLPPKLAQTIINLASPPLIKTDSSEASTQPLTVLDPFCGTGVILQEALLMGMNAFGTDSDTRMVMFSQQNIEWLSSRFPVSNEFHVTPGDATNFAWHEAFDMVASETYLGRPFSSVPHADVLKKVVSDVDTIHKKFLSNIATQTKTGVRLCLAVPAWRVGDNFTHLPCLDHLEKLGYTRPSFTRVDNKDLIYWREGQIVGRELVILVRK